MDEGEFESITVRGFVSGCEALALSGRAACTKPLLSVRAGLLKRNFKYETKSKIQMEW